MFIDTFPEEAKELCAEHGCKLTSLSDPIEAPIGYRYEVNGQYEIHLKEEKD